MWVSNSREDQQKQSPNSCRMCKCSESGTVYCFTKSCQNARYPSYARLSIPEPDSITTIGYSSFPSSIKEINARTIPFLADFVKTMRKDSLVLVAAGPKLTASSVLLVDSVQKKQIAVSQFTVRDLASSRVFYQYQSEQSMEGVSSTSISSTEFQNEAKTDFIQLMFISAYNQTVHSVLIEFEIGGGNGSGEDRSGISSGKDSGPKSTKGKNESLLSRSVKGLNGPSTQIKRVRWYSYLLFF